MLVIKELLLINHTVEPKTTLNLAEKYHNLKLIHNPEFLTAHELHLKVSSKYQKHIVLGKTKNVDEWVLELKNFYAYLYPDAEISTSVILMKVNL